MRRMFDKDEIADIAGGGIGELKSIDFPHGQETVTYDTTDGITLDATARLTHGVSNDTTDVPTTLSVPIIAGTGISMDADATNSKVNIKVDESKVPYYPNGVGNNKVLIRYGNKWASQAYSNSVVNDSIVSRTGNGRIKAATPTENNDCATKEYVDTAVAGAGGGAVTKVISTGSNYPTYTYTPEGKAVKIDFTISAQKIGEDAELSITLLGTTNRAIITKTVTSGQGIISGTIYHVPNGVYVNTSASETSGGVNDKLMGVVTLANVTDGTQVILKQDSQDVTGIQFTGQATGPTGSTIFGLITITPLT